MRICDACHVHVRGSMDRCPLCGTKLRGEKEENVFPRLQMYDHMYRKIMRIFLFLSVIAAVKEGFAKELTDEKVKGRLNDLCALEHNLLIRMVPLF